MRRIRCSAAIALVATMAVSACGASESTSGTSMDGSGTDAAVEEMATGATPADTTVLGPVVSAADVMFAVGAPEESPWGSGIVRSPAPGTSWEWVELPDGPKPSETAIIDWDVQPLDGGVFVSASLATPVAPVEEGEVPREPEIALWAWSSPDGTDWTGGAVGTFPGGDFGARFHRVGDALLRVMQRDGAVVVLHSLDAGRSWQDAPVAGITVVEGESAGLTGEPWTAPTGQMRALVGYHGQTTRAFEHQLIEAPTAGGPWTVADPACAPMWQLPRGQCHPSVEAGAVTVRGIEVSFDGGRTWADATFEQALDQDPQRDISGFSSLVPLPDGDWLGTVAGYIPAGGGPLAWVVHSADGRTWSTLLGPGVDGCTESPMDTDQPSAQAHPPVLVEDAAVAVFTCPGAGSGLYRIDTEAIPLHQVGPGQRLGEAFQHGGSVVAPVLGVDDRQVEGFAVVRP